MSDCYCQIVYPAEVKTQMRKIESGGFAPKDVDLFQELQWAYAKRMVTRPLKESFILDLPKAYAWPESSCPDFGKRKDNDYKNTPEK